MPDSVADFPWKKEHVAVPALQVHTGQCVLHTITVNSYDVGAGAQLWAEVYDGVAGGTLIATIDVTDPLFVGLAYKPPACLTFDCEMEDGIYIEVNPAPPTNMSLTVTFK